jgi:hypothetical protein
MTLHTRYSTPTSVMLQIVDDEALLFNSINNQFYTINTIGAVMWEVMQNYSILTDVLNELKEDFDISQDQLSNDLIAFGESLEAQQLIVCDAE